MPRPERGVPDLQRRTNGYFYATWYDGASRRSKALSLRTKSATEAQARFAAFLAQGADFYDNSAQGVSVKAVIESYRRGHVHPNVVDTERFEYAATQIVGFFGDTPVRDIDIDAGERYIEHRLDEGIAKSTIKREMSTLVAAANFCVKRRVIKPDEIPTIEYPNVDTNREIWLFKDEFRIYRDTKNADIRDFIDTMYFTGSRRRAVEQLSWNQVDLGNGLIRLAKDGEKKTKKRRPTVPIVPALREILERREMLADTDYVFGHSGSRYKSLVRRASNAGLLYLKARDGRPEGRFCPHTIRHTRATHLLQDGVDIYAVAKLLGDTIRTVETTYGHAAAGLTADAVLKSGF